YLVKTLMGFPRHLSQHVGGMVMSAGRLCELCPIENAAMAGRTVIQWDKDDLDELGILKVDVLALGMLSAIRRCFELVKQHHGHDWSLSTLPQGDRATYDMICRADTIGVFQIESRAQMSMLPRLKPRCFYDLVIEVAIVRPGPIQGDMVHPFLKARENPDSVVYPNDAIRQVLQKTLGVPIFQEQAMRLAVVAAGFTPGEADQLRRAMAAWRRPGVIDQFRLKLLEGMKENGLTGKFADQVFNQIRGFGEYGFPESHAASFALLVYVSCYLKCHYPAAFCVALLNSQPLGFYAPAQLVGDAKDHGVRVRAVDVNHSDWESTLEPDPNRDGPSIRLGLKTIRGLSEETAHGFVECRQQGGPFRDITDLSRRGGVSQATLAILADADALASIAGDRRAAIWQSLGQESRPGESPLFDSVDDEESVPEDLVAMSPLEEVYADYGAIGLSLKAHPMSFVRDELDRKRCTCAGDLSSLRNGQHVRVAGLVLLRQRPSTAKGIWFVTLEDETGSMNLVLFPKVWERFFKVAKTSNAWMVDGKLESKHGVIHVIVGRITDLSSEVDGLTLRSRDFR
ncbi:MAG: OB-fold nucleic acid binding domain-containing protein, partial [Planctomycetota bacterium]